MSNRIDITEGFRRAAAIAKRDSGNGSIPEALRLALEACKDAHLLIDEETAPLRAKLDKVEPDFRPDVEYQIWLIEQQLARASEEARRRIALIDSIRTSSEIAAEMDRCFKGDDSTVYWFNNWAWTADPREDASLSVIPFRLFPFQEDYVRRIDKAVFEDRSSLVTVKSRDVGVSWVWCDWAVQKYLNPHKTFQGLLGSRVEPLVDSIGEMDSLFEKLRFQLRLLPDWMLPEGFEWKRDVNWCRILNPKTQSVLGGESSNSNFGRGGRYTCLRGDSLVFTEKGILTFEEALALQAVSLMDDKGQFKRIKHYVVRPAEPLKEVNTKYGFKVVATADHPLLSKRGKEESIFRAVNELKVGGDYELKAVNAKAYDGDRLAFRALGSYPISDEFTTEDEAAVLGYLVSEGAASRREGKIEFVQKEQEIFDEYMMLYERAFGKRPAVRHCIMTSSKTGLQSEWQTAIACDVKTRRYLAALGLDYVKAPFKSIPIAVRRSSLKIMRAFLSALFEGDGSVDGCAKELRVVYTSKSEVLIRHLQIMLLAFNIVSSVRYERTRDIWRLVIDNMEALAFGAKIGFRSKRKNDKFDAYSNSTQNLRHQKRTGLEGLLNIRDIKDSASAVTYDVELEGHVFLVNGIVSHNCVIPDEYAAFPYGGYDAWTGMQQSSKSKMPVSTPKGLMNKFADLAKSGKMPVVELHWRQHPWKTEQWYEMQKRELTDAEIAQELNCDFEASQPGQVFPQWKELSHIIDEDEFLDFYGEPAVDDYGNFRIPKEWALGMAMDIGYSEQHRWVIEWYARPSEGYELSDACFLYRSYVVPLGFTPREVAHKIYELEAPHKEHERMSMRLISHEAVGELFTFAQQHALSFSQWDTKQGYNFGIPQMQNYLEVRKNYAHPFKADITGKSRFYVLCRHSKTLYSKETGKWEVQPAVKECRIHSFDCDHALFRREMPRYHFPESEKGKAVAVMRPFKAEDDSIDPARAIFAQFCPPVNPMEDSIKRAKTLPKNVQSGYIQQQSNPEYKARLAMTRQFIEDSRAADQEPEDSEWREQLRRG